MKVKELINRLSYYDQDLEVLMTNCETPSGIYECEVGTDLLINYISEDTLDTAVAKFGDERIILIYPKYGGWACRGI